MTCLAPDLRIDCRLAYYPYLGGKSFCWAHPVGRCPFGVPPYPTRVPASWWRRLWLGLEGY